MHPVKMVIQIGKYKIEADFDTEANATQSVILIARLIEEKGITGALEEVARSAASAMLRK